MRGGYSSRRRGIILRVDGDPLIEVGATSPSCKRSLKPAVERLAAWFPGNMETVNGAVVLLNQEEFWTA